MTTVVGIAEFKAKCERLINQMEKDGEPIMVTRRGKVVATVSPSSQQPEKERKSAFGCMQGTVTIHGDLDEPIDPDWETKWEAKWDERGYTAPANSKR